MKRVFIIHGWGGSPGSNWFPWLKKELESRGYEVQVPAMPDPDNPRIDSWISKISEDVGKADQNTYLVGHSMGCPAIVRYLETLPENTQVGGAVFVAGFFLPLTPPNGSWDDSGDKIDNHWSESPINFNKIRSHLKNSVAIFSDNDPWVPLENKNIFSKELNSKIIVEHDAGHLNEGFGFTELPQVLDAMLEIASIRE